MGKKKFYVVWHGANPGIYDSWKDCKLQINGFEGAVYKSFDSKEEAEKAYSSSPYIYIGTQKKAEALLKSGLADLTGNDTHRLSAFRQALQAPVHWKS